MRKAMVAGMVFLAALMLSQACSNHGAWRDQLINELASYNEIELVTFNIAGSTVCDTCKGREDSIIGVKIEVVPKDEPLTELSITMFDGVGPFTIPNLRYKKGASLTIRAQAYTGLDQAGYSGESVVTVPNNDDETTTVMIAL